MQGLLCTGVVRWFNHRPASDGLDGGTSKSSMGKMTNSSPVVGFENCTQQVAALCWRHRKGRLQVLMITSRETARWVIPKGWPMPGLTGAEAATREAWEEAGVEGCAQDLLLGYYAYDKIAQPAPPLHCAVAVYGLQIENLRRRFPERRQRRRKWFDASDAALLVAETGLRLILQQISESGGLLAEKPSATSSMP